MANTGITIFLGVILFNIFMFIACYAANADASITPIGNSNNLNYNITGSTTTDLSVTDAVHWYDGFRISVFVSEDQSWWFDAFYIAFQGLLITVSVYALIRGLS